MFQMSLRAVFQIPYTCETHTDQIKHGGVILQNKKNTKKTL